MAQPPWTGQVPHRRARSRLPPAPVRGGIAQVFLWRLGQSLATAPETRGSRCLGVKRRARRLPPRPYYFGAREGGGRGSDAPGIHRPAPVAAPRVPSRARPPPGPPGNVRQEVVLTRRFWLAACRVSSWLNDRLSPGGDRVDRGGAAPGHGNLHQRPRSRRRGPGRAGKARSPTCSPTSKTTIPATISSQGPKPVRGVGFASRFGARGEGVSRGHHPSPRGAARGGPAVPSGRSCRPRRPAPARPRARARARPPPSGSGARSGLPPRRRGAKRHGRGTARPRAPRPETRSRAPRPAPPPGRRSAGARPAPRSGEPPARVPQGQRAPGPSPGEGEAQAPSSA